MFNLDVARDTLASGERPRSAAPPAARACGLIAAVCLGFLLPVVMVVANKSAPAILGAAAAFATAAALLGGQWIALKARYRTILAGANARVVLAVLALLIVSLAWTVDQAATVRGLVEGVPELAFAFAAAAAWPLVARGRDAHWLLLGIAGAAVLIAAERLGGMQLHTLVHARGEVYDLKRSAIPPVLLVWPAVAFCLYRGRRAGAAALFAAALGGAVLAHSGAPGFALIAAGVVFFLARAAPRATVGGLAVVLASLVVAGAWTGTLATRLLRPAVEDALSEQHASHRVRIWSAFETRVRDRPILGHGFAASTKVAAAPRPDGKPPEPDNDLIVNNHPHNVFLEFWIELGLAGGVSAAAVLAFVLRRIDASSAETLAARAACLVAVALVGLVGLSAWQPWWLAAIAATLIWFDAFERHRLGGA